MRGEDAFDDLDQDLLAAVEAGVPWRHRVWEPSNVAVVLGRGTAQEREVHGGTCSEDNVPVLRRRGGGGAVVLGPGCAVVSFATIVEKEFEMGGYLDSIARFLGEVLSRITGLPLETRGIGDVCTGERKLLGSSLFRRRRLLFYQGSLLHSLDLSLVDRYLAHPVREPAYRRGRPHRDFLTTLQAEGVGVSCRELSEELQRELPAVAGRIR